MRLTYRKCCGIGLFFICISFAVLVITYIRVHETYAEYEKPDSEKFVSLAYSQGRTGNQMFRLLSGYGIARRLGRKLSILIDVNRGSKRVRDFFLQTARLFPSLAENVVIRRSNSSVTAEEHQAWTRFPNPTFSLISSEIEHTVAPLAMTSDGKADAWKYEDPIKYRGHPAKYLVLNSIVAQNARYFTDYLPEIRKMFKFSTSMHAMDEIVESFSKKGIDFMCVHIRRTDFIKFQWETHFGPTLSAARSLAKRHELSRYLIFGDDRKFMKRLADRLSTQTEEAIFSTRNIYEDFYLSSRLCRAFLISSGVSTSGWTLAFFTQNQSVVYYTTETITQIPDLREHFLPEWNPLPN